MEQAARTHWRAAAWLLERQNPEEYARKPVNVTSPKKVATALRFVQEAALEAVPAEFHEALYQHVQAAMAEAFRHCFPTMGKWGVPKFPKLPIDTPLADVQTHKAWEANVGILHDGGEHVAPPSPVGRVELAERQAAEAARRAAAAELKRLLTEQPPAELSPKTCEATAVACDAPPVDPLYVAFAAEEAVFTEQERRREQRQSSLELRRAMAEAEQRPSVFFPSTAAVEPPAGRGVRRQERQKERAAEKKAKAARKRAQAQRRRAA
jgi:hypothetical protein